MEVVVVVIVVTIVEVIVSTHMQLFAQFIVGANAIADFVEMKSLAEVILQLH